MKLIELIAESKLDLKNFIGHGLGAFLLAGVAVFAIYTLQFAGPELWAGIVRMFSSLINE